MITINKQLRDLEPLMHKILRKFKITKSYYKDYLQELRIVAWQVLQKYDEKRGALSTIMQIAMQNRLKNLLRRRDKNVVYLEDLSFYEKNYAIGVENHIRNDIDLKDIKNRLSKRERQIIELYLSGRTQAEIGQMLKISRLKVQRQLQAVFSKIENLSKGG